VGGDGVVVGSDGMPSSTARLVGGAQHDNPLRGGTLHTGELPAAGSRPAGRIMARPAAAPLPAKRAFCSDIDDPFRSPSRPEAQERRATKEGIKR
jgi:hypothetical protein